MYSNLFRIGRDTELRFTQGGKAVCGVALACDVGYGDNKRTSWIEGVLWDKRAEALVQYLIKGKQVFVVMDDIEIETWAKEDGTTGSKLKGRIVDVKLVSDSKPQQSQPKAASNQHPPGFDDDIGF